MLICNVNIKLDIIVSTYVIHLYVWQDDVGCYKLVFFNSLPTGRTNLVIVHGVKKIFFISKV